MNNIMNKRGNVATVEFVIVMVILTFFIFFPFAIYSSYSQKNVLENIKDRGLHLTASKGAPDDEVINSLINEFEFYGLEPKEGEQIIIRFYKLSLTDNGMETEDTSVYEIKKEGESLNFEQFGEMSKALKENKDIIRITIEYPADNFLNSILGLIYGKKEGDEKVLTNSNATGAAYSIAVSGFIMSEYSDKIGQIPSGGSGGIETGSIHKSKQIEPPDNVGTTSTSFSLQQLPKNCKALVIKPHLLEYKKGSLRYPYESGIFINLSDDCKYSATSNPFEGYIKIGGKTVATLRVDGRGEHSYLFGLTLIQSGENTITVVRSYSDKDEDETWFCSFTSVQGKLDEATLSFHLYKYYHDDATGPLHALARYYYYAVY